MTQSEPAGFFRTLSLLLRIQIVRSARQLTGGIGLFRKKRSRKPRRQPGLSAGGPASLFQEAHDFAAS